MRAQNGGEAIGRIDSDELSKLRRAYFGENMPILRNGAFL